MKQLTLMRHGKSDWGGPFHTDFERPLKKRGRRDAPRMGEYLAALDLVPDLIVSSPAERALQTAELFADALGYDDDIEWEDDIYGATAGELLTVLRQQPDYAEHIVLIGHNPGFEELASCLIGTASSGPGRGIRLPTAAMAHIILDIGSWQDARAGSGRLRWLVTPRTLQEDDS